MTTHSTTTKNTTAVDDAARGRRRALPRARKPLIAAGVLAALAGGAGACTVLLADRDEPGTRQELVAQRGERIMPFDLTRTTHVFRADRLGGVQRVLADDKGDRRNVRLIREHLRTEALAFRRGDFGDPAAIHGEQMPGLRALRDGHRRITVQYRDLASGAQLSYRTRESRLVRALGAWFDAQLSDHGDDATSGGHSR